MKPWERDSASWMKRISLLFGTDAARTAEPSGADGGNRCGADGTDAARTVLLAIGKGFCYNVRVP